MRKALFINADSSKPRCAVFQAGKIYGAAMQESKELEIEYMEVGDGSTLPDPTPYDAVIFNYQHLTMQIMPPEYFSYCKIAIGFLYEARSDPGSSPLHIDGLMAGQLFDVLISPDPTLESTPRAWGVPRVIPRLPLPTKLDPRGNYAPLIKTFGFPSPWKNLKGVVEMMNDEFTEATFQLSFSQASHQISTPLYERQIEAALALNEITKPGIHVEVIQGYKTDEELVAWLNDSDLNVFLSYPERGIQTGGALLASADMAISAQRPLLVSNNIEARHLAGCRDGNLSLKTAMQNEHQVRWFYNTWSPQEFAIRFDELVREYLP